MSDYKKELKQCINELCLHCGEYVLRHKGTCDGCRWYEIQNKLVKGDWDAETD